MPHCAFVSGCRNHCKGCFQPQTWEFDYGEPFDEQIQNEILDSLKPSYVQGNYSFRSVILL